MADTRQSFQIVQAAENIASDYNDAVDRIEELESENKELKAELERAENAIKQLEDSQ